MANAQPAPDPEAIARSLGAPRRGAGGSWACRCPAHEDRTPSLTLKLEGNTLLWHCHAGCSQDAVRAALVERGLIEPGKPNGNAPPPRFTSHRGGKDQPEQPEPPELTDPDAIPEPRPMARILASYDYVDQAGNMLFQVVRLAPKQFLQRRRDGKKWLWGLGRTKPCLYRLDKLADAITVIVAEGEKDVDRLVSLGFCATCNPMGAGKWQPEYATALADKHVVIIPDNDEPGRRHAEAVLASCLEGDVRSVRLLDLPGLKQKGDASDWLDAGGTPHQLKELIRHTKPYRHQDSPRGDAYWRARLVFGQHGPVANEFNAMVALTRAPELIGRVRHDAFCDICQGRELPWSKSPEWNEWTEQDDVELACWLQKHEINIHSHNLPGVVTAVARANEHHPVREYLNSLTWDKVPRISVFPSRYLGIQEVTQAKANAPTDKKTDLSQVFMRKWLISAVARIFDPGCQADHAIIFEGDEGLGKSTAIRNLAEQQWFADQISPFDNKDASQDLRGKWLIEMSELTNFNAVNAVKAFISRRFDHYRPSYGHRSRDFLRQCVHSGTTNLQVYLKDTTGNRRFWPIKVREIDYDAIKRDRDQIWAEAVAAYRSGEQWWLDKEHQARAVEIQQERLEEDPWEAKVITKMKETSSDGRSTFDGIPTTLWVLTVAVGKWPKDITKKDQMRAGTILNALGWRRTEKRHPQTGGRVYERIPPKS